MPGAAAAAAENGGLQNGYDVTVGVDPRDPDRVYIGFQELYLSTSGGLTFGTPAITANRVHFDHHATVFSPHGPTSPADAVLRRDGRWDRAQHRRQHRMDEPQRDDRDQPAPRNGHRPGVGREQPLHLRGLPGHGDEPSMPRSSAGNDWHLGVDGDGTRVIVDPGNPLRVYARDNQSLIVTSDGGTSWTFPTAAATGLPAVTGRADANAKPMGVDPNASAVVYVASDRQFFRSTDTGATFTAMNTFPGNVSALATTKQDSKILIVGCEDGSVHRTTNADAGAGSIWTALAVNGAPNRIVSGAAIDPTDVKSVAICYSGFSGISAVNRTAHVFFSADVTTTAFADIGGTDGAGPDPNIPDLPVHTIVIDSSTTPHSVIVGCDTDVLRTTDSGATWHIYGAGLPNADCTSLAIDHALTPPLLRVGTYGRSAFELARLSGPRIIVRANLAFDNVLVGSTSDLTFTVFNVGDANLSITGVVDNSSNPNYALPGLPAMPIDLAPGAQSTMTVRFAPTVPGKHLTALTSQLERRDAADARRVGERLGAPVGAASHRSDPGQRPGRRRHVGHRDGRWLHRSHRCAFRRQRRNRLHGGQRHPDHGYHPSRGGCDQCHRRDADRHDRSEPGRGLHLPRRWHRRHRCQPVGGA